MRAPYISRRNESDLAMTPMIDVVFLLLIFFVCTASFQMAEAILPTSLLAAGTAPSNLQSQIEPPPEQVVVRATLQNGQPRWAVDERLCATLLDVRTVLAAVFEIDASVPVILDMDGDMPLGHAIDVYDLCRLIGFDRIQFAASIE